ncbi:OmpW family outer membrane protein [Oleiagrimonas sp. C23AA]|uniref:OmpW/AlkL family protein n=1 Tax=Oleiagrimonas sp. C23AA TaxID=2719047 RepID=UPI00141E3476|nr:OmpW family outer membrane protein [Oleiagrimonas sp. C23AA]NII10640.1 OmpW family protein [Oleiagrimonas sp. C23AA]
MLKVLSVAVAGVLALGASTVSHAADANPWVFKFGVHTVQPKSDNGRLAGGALKADVGNDTKPTLSLEYMFTPNWGVEVLGALPFKHELKLNGAKAGTFKHLPPTVSVQYHFNPNGQISPFVGVGLNYTTVFDEKTTGPLAGTKLSVGDSWGEALHVGLDYNFAPRWLFTVDARWMNIDAKAKVNGASVGTVHVDPMVYGVAFGYRF